MEQFKRFCEEDSGAHFCELPNIGDYFSMADVLFSDVSSVAYEFAGLNKPVILFDSPLMQNHVHYDRSLLEYRYRGIGPRINRLDQLPVVLKELEKQKFRPAKKQQEMARHFLSVSDGSSSRRVIKAAISITKKRKPRATVLLHHVKRGGNIKSILRRLGDRYQVIAFGNALPKGLSCECQDGRFLMKDILEKAPSLMADTQLLIYLDTSWDFSPNALDLLAGHFQFEKDLDVLSPLGTSLDTHPDFTPYNFGLEIGYKLVGECLRTSTIDGRCFVLRKKALKKLLRSLPDQGFYPLKNSGLNIALALDALIYSPESLEDFGPRGADIYPIHSVFLNFLHLDQSHAPKNFIRNVYSRLKAMRVSRGVRSDLMFYTDAGSALAVKSQWRDANSYLEKGKKAAPFVKDKGVLGRFWYHMGCAYIENGQVRQARSAFKKCLKATPGVRQGSGVV